MASTPPASDVGKAPTCSSVDLSTAHGQPGAHDGLHVSLGACFTDFAGWKMPLRYGSETAEHHAVRQAAGIFDLSHMGEIEVHGTEAVDVLDAALVSDISAVPVGRAKYTMICDEHGGIIDDLVVYRLTESNYLVAANAATVHMRLSEHVGDRQAQVDHVSEDSCLIAVQGPASLSILRAAAESDPSSLRYYAIRSARIAGYGVLLARTGYTGEDGFEIYCRRAMRPASGPRCWPTGGRMASFPPASRAATRSGWKPECRSTDESCPRR